MKIRRFSNGDEISLFRVFSHLYIRSHHTTTHVNKLMLGPQQISTSSDGPITLRNYNLCCRAGWWNSWICRCSTKWIHWSFLCIRNLFKTGVGTLLMNCIHEEARQRGISELTSNVSKAAEVFFLRHGFHIVERGFPICRGVTLQNALMRKCLAK